MFLSIITLVCSLEAAELVPKPQSENYYERLGAEKTMSDAELKRSYKRAALQFHPDKKKAESPEEELSITADFQNIQEAWEVLGSPDSRSLYDQGKWNSGRSRTQYREQDSNPFFMMGSIGWVILYHPWTQLRMSAIMRMKTHLHHEVVRKALIMSVTGGNDIEIDEGIRRAALETLSYGMKYPDVQKLFISVLASTAVSEVCTLIALEALSQSPNLSEMKPYFIDIIKTDQRPMIIEFIAQMAFLKEELLQMMRDKNISLRTRIMIALSQFGLLSVEELELAKTLALDQSIDLMLRVDLMGKLETKRLVKISEMNIFKNALLDASSSFSDSDKKYRAIYVLGAVSHHPAAQSKLLEIARSYSADLDLRISAVRALKSVAGNSFVRSYLIDLVFAQYPPQALSFAVYEIVPDLLDQSPQVINKLNETVRNHFANLGDRIQAAHILGLRVSLQHIKNSLLYIVSQGWYPEQLKITILEILKVRLNDHDVRSVFQMIASRDGYKESGKRAKLLLDLNPPPSPPVPCYAQLSEEVWDFNTNKSAHTPKALPQ
ncbi:MAG: J domain-containing protein [Xanthomonadaceae bacterium]|nr:J domain-containing protein [Xanthomonadaceae bacterium]